jgi:hypothetical protein
MRAQILLSFLSLLLPTALFAQSVAVWDFAARDGTKNNTTQSLTEEFEEALEQDKNYAVFDRRNIDRLRAVIDNEKALRNISSADSQRLKLLGVSVVAFGVLFDDTESGDASVSVSLEDFTGKLLGKESVSMRRGLLKDHNSRQEKMIELAKKISGVTSTSDPGASRKPVNQYSVVFDEKERVLADFGAMPLLEGISITQLQANQGLQIVVKPREFLGAEPILTSLDASARITGERGTGFTWIFKVYWIQCIVAEDPPEAGPERFRLELLK